MARIVFAGSPAFVLSYLEWLESSEHELVAVYTQPDRPTGRGRQVQAGPVKSWAEKHRTAVFQPNKWDQETINQLKELKADIFLVVAYGMILPEAALSAAKIDCLNIHYSLLPRWRGAAPVIHALLAGDSETGVCLMQMEKGLDTGAVYARCKTSLEQPIPGGELTEKLTTLGVELLNINLAKIISGELAATAQATAGANYASKINKTMAVIDWEKSSTEIMRQILAFNPWPIAQTTFENKTLRIARAKLNANINHKTNESTKPGCIINCNNETIDVLCGDGKIISLQEVQAPGKKMQPAKEFLNAKINSIKVMETCLGNQNK